MFQGSGVIFTIEFGLESFTIDPIILLTVVWPCFAPLVHRWISTYPLSQNGNRRISKSTSYLLLQPNRNRAYTRLLYRPQLAVDGNMQLVHLKMKRPEDDVSLSDGELFIVKRAPYAEHLSSAPQRQPVSSITYNTDLITERCQEIKMQ